MASLAASEDDERNRYCDRNLESDDNIANSLDGAIREQSQKHNSKEVVRGSSLSSSKLQLALPSDIRQAIGGTENFAEVVKERTRLRREREDAALSNLTVQVSRLEAALQAESKRRAKAVQVIKQQAVKEIQQMEETVRNQMHEETVLVEKRLLAIEDRISALEQRWLSDVTALSTDLERNRREIDSELQELYSVTERERQSRVAREKMLEKRLQDTSLDYQERWTKERQDRISAVTSIHDAVKEQGRNHDQLTASFEQKINQEIQYLTQDIEREVVERQTNDDEIVAALNRYTAQLQQTLSYATTG